MNVLYERGFIHQMSDENGLDELAAKEAITAYIGFDCTAPSLHAGSLLPIMVLYWLQQTGHKPIALMGGGTSKIGDPSGKDTSRQMLTSADIDVNMSGIRKVFDKFLTFGDGSNDALMVNNADWLDELNYISLLRDYGPHFTINRMLTFDSVKLRLEREQPLTFLEFNYMILQAYDFAELYRRFGCVAQMGGSDQWGNIINGIELGRRVEGAQLYGLTTPLLTSASGAKMGKTANGAVWLNEDMLSAYEYWQYFRNTDDADVTRFLKLFTLLPLSEIDRLSQLEGAELNDAKKLLANEATSLLHGRQAAEAASETARSAFEDGANAAGLPSIDMAASAFDQDGCGLLSVLVDAGLAASNGEARRHVQGNAIKVNDAVVKDPKQTLTAADIHDGLIKLSMGKKKHVLIKVV